MDTRKFILLWTLVVLIVVTLAWSPWLTAARVEAAAEETFTRSWQGVVDGCGLDCTGCGVTSSRRVLFGAVVEIEYACGLTPASLPAYRQQAAGFVSCFGTVHNLPEP